mmetsp:Transcript_2830/g.5050  ORF Transcript_2830/g.5050 Transcript_2830/m.5050 type:complete len:241 (+) Transcript_2830:79-801(+)
MAAATCPQADTPSQHLLAQHSLVSALLCFTTCETSWAPLLASLGFDVISSVSNWRETAIVTPRSSGVTSRPADRARDWANRIVFLICRPLSSCSANGTGSMWLMPAAERRLRQTSQRADSSRGAYWRATLMRLWNAGSKEDTRLVVRKRTPWWYSSRRKKMPTMAFRWMSVRVRASRKMSASSMRTTAFQAWAISRISRSLFSRSTVPVPSSPTEMEYRGRRNSSEMASAVKVLPVPGVP